MFTCFTAATVRPVRRRAAFTLIELLVVVVVIGILASIAIARYSSVKQRAYVASMQNDLRNIVTAQEIYFEKAQAYTNDPTQLNILLRMGVTVTDLVSGSAPDTWAATVAHEQTAKTCTIQVNDPLASTGLIICQ